MQARSSTLALLAALTAGPIHVHAEDVAAQFQSLLSDTAKQAGLSVRKAGGEEVLNVGGSTMLAPASTAKVISTGCGLLRLGPQFKFITDFGYTGKYANGTVNGNLVIRGHGDPSLVLGDLYEIVQILRHAHGVRKVTGQLVFDASYFGKPSISMSEDFGGDEGRSFATVLTPTPFNQNSFALWITSPPEAGAVARISLSPIDVLDLKIKNEVKPGGATGVNVRFDPGLGSIRAGGTIERGGEKAVYRAVGDVYAYYEKFFRQLWKDSGGEWAKGAHSVSTSPQAGLKVLHSHQSRPLAKILMDTNKYSLNLSAELILLAAAADQEGSPATLEKAQKQLRECMRNLGIADGDAQLTNASGLSRDARIKPAAMTQFLSKMSGQFVAPEYLSSFALAGMDGTVETRLKGYTGRLRAKTGSMQGVRSIAGYFHGKNRDLYSFSLLLNGLKGSDGETRSKEDQVLQKLLAIY